MAIIHRAQLVPNKLELLAEWLPTRAWFAGPRGVEPERITAFRFEDPEGEVGIETLIVRVGDGPLLHVPLTYRGAPLDGADASLVGTMEHSVLGNRWVYDGCADPAYLSALAHTILSGGTEAPEFVEVDSRLQQREPLARVRGTGGAIATLVGALQHVDDGDPTVLHTDTLELVVVRVLDAARAVSGGALTLSGTWEGQDEPVLLASARPR